MTQQDLSNPELLLVLCITIALIGLAALIGVFIADHIIAPLLDRLDKAKLARRSS